MHQTPLFVLFLLVGRKFLVAITSNQPLVPCLATGSTASNKRSFGVGNQPQSSPFNIMPGGRVMDPAGFLQCRMETKTKTETVYFDEEKQRNAKTKTIYEYVLDI